MIGPWIETDLDGPALRLEGFELLHRPSRGHALVFIGQEPEAWGGLERIHRGHGIVEPVDEGLVPWPQRPGGVEADRPAGYAGAGHEAQGRVAPLDGLEPGLPLGLVEQAAELVPAVLAAVGDGTDHGVDAVGLADVLLAEAFLFQGVDVTPAVFAGDRDHGAVVDEQTADARGLGGGQGSDPAALAVAGQVDHGGIDPALGAEPLDGGHHVAGQDVKVLGVFPL